MILHSAILLIVSLVFLFDPIPKGQRDREKVEKKLYCSWFEKKVIVNGITDPKGYEFMAWEFKKTWPESWSFRGEVSYNGYEETIIDLSKPDWRMDIVKKDPDGKKKSVLPGIFKFENDTLIWATSSHWTNFSEEGEYETRPTTFESTGKNERTVRHLRPWKEYLDEVKK